jgi:hypothetical protein
MGAVSRDIDDLLILLEPGEFKPDYSRNTGPGHGKIPTKPFFAD